MRLLVPALAELDHYAEALRRGGFFPDNIRREVSAREELAKIAADPAAFVASLDDREGKAGPVTLPDGSQVTVPALLGVFEDGDRLGIVTTLSDPTSPGAAAPDPAAFSDVLQQAYQVQADALD